MFIPSTKLNLLSFYCDCDFAGIWCFCVPPYMPHVSRTDVSIVNMNDCLLSQTIALEGMRSNES